MVCVDGWASVADSDIVEIMVLDFFVTFFMIGPFDATGTFAGELVSTFLRFWPIVFFSVEAGPLAFSVLFLCLPILTS